MDTKKLKEQNMDQNNFSMQITSPITNSANVTKIKTFEVSWIIAQWRQQFNYDVSYLFEGVSVLELFKCNDTGYLFFEPNTMGDSKLYEHLQRNNGYYMPWKWEHEIATMYVKEGISLLEIGCAEGHYLEKIRKDYKITVAGIETNSSAVNRAREKGLNIYEELIENHSIKNSLKYDIICCFQVLEHVSDVKSFIDSCLACLTSDGFLIISVPNNLSFISEFDQLLNMPPHHIGYWDEYSLQNISSFFSMTFESIFKEPLQKYHEGFFKSTIYRKVFGNFYTNKITGKLLRFFLLRPFVDKHVKYFSKWVFGHTILVVYRKTGKNRL